MRRSKMAQGSDFFPGFTEIVEIGIGSLATVYRAREIGTNRLVALKLLNVRDAAPRAIESFERESVALGAVSSHPNIVTLFRSFRAADGRPVLVLELCSGSVGDRMPEGHGLPVPDVVSLGIKIAGALETAHRAQILHRDVKPQNILITEFGEPALADFGVAMLQSSTQTTAGLFDFTTLHAAPELLEGGATSAATDVYELASSLYQLIAGRSAFRAYEGESPASVILRILRDPVQPLVNAQVPPTLSDLLVRAMSKDQGSRPPTAAEFAAGLGAVEAAARWPRTQLLVRDGSGSGGPAGGPAGMAMHRPPSGPPVGLAPAPVGPPPPGPAVGVPPAFRPPSVPVTAAAPPPAAPAPITPAPVLSRPEPPRTPPPAPAPEVPAGSDWSAPTISGHPASAVEVEHVSTRATAEAAPSVARPVKPEQPVEPEPPVEPEASVEPEAPVEPEPPAEPQPQSEPVDASVLRPVDEPAVEAAAADASDGGATDIWSAVSITEHEVPAPSAPASEPPEPSLPPDPPLPPEPSLPPEPPVPPADLAPPADDAAPPAPAPAEGPPVRFDPPPDSGQLVSAEPSEIQGPPPPPPLPDLIVPWRLQSPDVPDEASLVPADETSPAAGYDAPDEDADQQAVQYPIPPTGLSSDQGTGGVPTWAFRAASQRPAGQPPIHDLTLDPMSLRQRVTIRSGGSSLQVDAERLVLRSWMKRVELRWPDVVGFEPQLDEDPNAGGRLLAITRNGPVELPATRRSGADLRYLHALLDAYRHRASMTSQP